MPAHTRSRRALVIATLLGTVMAVAACGGPTDAEPPTAGMDDMAGMSMAPTVSSMAEADSHLIAIGSIIRGDEDVRLDVGGLAMLHKRLRAAGRLEFDDRADAPRMTRFDGSTFSHVRLGRT